MRNRRHYSIEEIKLYLNIIEHLPEKTLTDVRKLIISRGVECPDYKTLRRWRKRYSLNKEETQTSASSPTSKYSSSHPDEKYTQIEQQLSCLQKIVNATPTLPIEALLEPMTTDAAKIQPDNVSI